MKYIPANEKEKKEMLESIGVSSFEKLIEYIPQSLRQCCLNLKNGISEHELMREFKEISKSNKTTEDFISFIGCGIYDHYIPPVIKHIVSRPEFYTAYTPYQPEVSQGTLQVIYEYQSMVCELYGMEIANASMYDGATATAEACHMAMSVKNKHKVLLSEGLHPMTREVIHTYLKGQSIEYELVKLKDGEIDFDDLLKKADDSFAAFVIQTPNFFGIIEDGEKIGSFLKEKKILLIVNQNPMSTAVLKPAGIMGADIAVGEAQALGINQSFGGPLLGIFASKKEYSRLMPGRIIAKTTDKKNREGFVMTLQTREQHIRREKATSNICTNEGLCMLMAAVYLEALGREGFKRVSKDSLLSAHYLAGEISKTKVSLLHPEKEFFNEFAVKIDDLDRVYDQMKKRGFLIGVKLERFSKDYRNFLLIASTEKKSKNDIDRMIHNLKEVL